MKLLKTYVRNKFIIKKLIFFNNHEAIELLKVY